jgi:hypothetical protein
MRLAMRTPHAEACFLFGRPLFFPCMSRSGLWRKQGGYRGAQAWRSSMAFKLGAQGPPLFHLSPRSVGISSAHFLLAALLLSQLKGRVLLLHHARPHLSICPVGRSPSGGVGSLSTTTSQQIAKAIAVMTSGA